MTPRHTRPSTVTRELRHLLRLVGLAIGLGVLLLVFVPATVAVVLALSGGSDLAVLGLLAFAGLGFLLVLLSLPVAVVGVASMLGLRAVSAMRSHVTDRRVELFRRVEAAEETRWWGRFVRPSARLGDLDPRTADERFEAQLDDARAAYVAGGLSDAQLERVLDRLFGLESDAAARGQFDVAWRGSRLEERVDRPRATSAERKPLCGEDAP